MENFLLIYTSFNFMLTVVPDILADQKVLFATRGCGCWGAARYGAVLAVEYVRAVLRLSRSVQGGKGFLRHLPNIKLIGQQAAKLWGFFANNAISSHDLDLWPLDLEIGPRGAGVPGTLHTKFGIRRPFRFPSRWRHGRDRQRDRKTDRQDQHMMGPPSRKDGPIIIQSGTSWATSHTTESWNIDKGKINAKCYYHEEQKTTNMLSIIHCVPKKHPRHFRL